MKGRVRKALVPKNGIEIFEVRIALYFAPDGRRHVKAIVSDPDDADLDRVDLVELRGAIDAGRDYILSCYDQEDE